MVYASQLEFTQLVFSGPFRRQAAGIPQALNIASGLLEIAVTVLSSGGGFFGGMGTPFFVCFYIMCQSSRWDGNPANPLETCRDHKRW